MSNFFKLLPSEVVAEVIRYISQHDCIECLRVCHQWRDEIPAHSRQVWRQISIIDERGDFYELPETKSNVLWEKNALDCLKKCLGPHVRETRLYGLTSDSILRNLANLSCSITFLEINGHQYRNGAKSIVGAISQFKSTLTELILESYPYDILLTHLLRTLPKLTHLTFSSDIDNATSNAPEENIFGNDANDSCGFSSSIVYLHMRATSVIKQPISSILSICPNLRALVIPKFAIDEQSFETYDLLGIRCPLLRYLLLDKHGFIRPYMETLERWKVASTSSKYDEKVGTLREVIYANNHANNTIIPLLDRSQQHLVHAKFHIPSRFRDHNNIPSQNKKLAQLRFLQLKHLTLYAPTTKANGWVDFVVKCERLESLNILTDGDDDLLRRIVEAARTPIYLRTLNLHTRFTRDITPTNLTIRRITETFPVVQKLHLCGISVCDQDLHYICGLPALRTFILETKYISDWYSQEGLLEAADQLQIIQYLELNHVHKLTDAVLERLGQVESLSELVINTNHEITEQGVLTFVNGPHNGKRSCYVHDCQSIGTETIEKTCEWHS